MQNPQLLEELVTLLKQSEGFQSLPVSQQEMIIRTYETATDPQIERALEEFRKTEDKVEHINHKEEKLIKKEMKIEQKVEKLEKKKAKLEKKEMNIVNKAVIEVSKHQMTIDDLTGEKPVEINPAKSETTPFKMPKVSAQKKDKKTLKPELKKEKVSSKTLPKSISDEMKKLAEKMEQKSDVGKTTKASKAVKQLTQDKNTTMKNKQLSQKKAVATEKKVVSGKKKSAPVQKKEEKKEAKKGFFGFIKKRFFGGKK